MNDKQKEIIDIFLKENPQYKKAEYDEHDKEIVVFFAHKKEDEPFTVAEFIHGSPTKRLLTKVNDLLRQAEDS